MSSYQQKDSFYRYYTMMNQAEIFKKIGTILSELQDQYDFLAKNPEQLNELELELFLANANFLSDHVEIVRKLNAGKTTKALPQQTEISKEETEQVPPKPPVPEQVPAVDELPEPKDYSFFDKPVELVDYIKEDPAPEHTFEFVLNDLQQTDKFDYEEKPVDALFDRALSPEEERVIAEKQRAREQQVLQAETKPEPPVVPQPLPDLVPDVVGEKTVQPAAAALSEDKIEKKITAAEPAVAPAVAGNPRPTLNDLLGGKGNAASPAPREEQTKEQIRDLKGAITLNEKLLYIKDLFNGYNLAYSEAIELINKMPDLKTADTFLKNNYAEKNNWQAKQNTVEKFYELLARRFPNG